MEELSNIYDLINTLMPLFLLALGYIVGTKIEKKHYESIKQREYETIKFPVVNFKNPESFNPSEIEKSELVTGSVVISVDYFKRFVSFLRDIFGGRVGAYESLIDRARREAILRMKENAKGADLILNLKLQGAGMGKTAGTGKGAVHSVEVIAYGTAITYKKNQINLNK